MSTKSVSFLLFCIIEIYCQKKKKKKPNKEKDTFVPLVHVGNLGSQTLFALQTIVLLPWR